MLSNVPLEYGGICMSTKKDEEFLIKRFSRDLEVLEEIEEERLPGYRMMNTGKFYSWPKN